MLAGLLPRFWSVGAEVTDLGSALLSRRPGLEDEPTTTFLHRMRPATGVELMTLLTRAQQITGAPCRRVFLDEDAPAWVEAALIARDWDIDAVLQLVMPPNATVPLAAPAPYRVRPAEPADWEQLALLFRADHEEEDRSAGRPVRPEIATHRVVAARRALPEPVRYMVAVDPDGADVAGFVAAWPGDEGTGLVEDLFVRPSDRGRSLATTLVSHAATWARANGAGPVVIGARPDDTPKHLYQRLGFLPSGVLRTATAGGR